MKNFKILKEKNIILGIAGYKCDIYEKEDVPENNIKQFAEKLKHILKQLKPKIILYNLSFYGYNKKKYII